MEKLLQQCEFKFNRQLKAYESLSLIFKKMERRENLKNIEFSDENQTILRFYTKEQTLITRSLYSDFSLTPNITLNISTVKSNDIDCEIVLYFREKFSANTKEIKDILKCYFINNIHNHEYSNYEFRSRIKFNISSKDTPSKLSEKISKLVKKIRIFEEEVVPNNYHRFILFLSSCLFNNKYTETTIAPLTKKTVISVISNPTLPKRETVMKVIKLIEFIGENDIYSPPINGFNISIEDYPLKTDIKFNDNSRFIRHINNKYTCSVVIIKYLGEIIFKEILTSLRKFLYIRHPGLLLFVSCIEKFNKFDTWEINIQKTVLLSQRLE